MTEEPPSVQDDSHLKAIYDALVGDTDIGQILNRLAEAVAACLRAERATVYCVRTETAELESAAVVGNVLRRIRLPISHTSLAGHCAASQKAFLVADAYGDLTLIHEALRFDRSWDALNGFRTRDVLCAPVIFRNQTLGVVQAINGRHGPFQQEDLRQLTRLAQYTAYALYHARLYDDLTALRHLKQEKARFMRVMVHELKSPIAAIHMLASAQLQVSTGDQGTSVPNTSHAAFVQRVLVRMDELHGMIHEILQLAQVESGDPLGNVAELDLRAESERVCESYRERMDAKGLSFHVDLPAVAVPVRFDQKGYQLVVSNLLSNALKYTPKGSVEVVLRVASREAIMEVRDTGMGIPVGDLPRIFQEFYRASNARRQRITGTGVGLSGVKDLVERFGGNMRLESREEAGTTVTVSLPLVPDCAP